MAKLETSSKIVHVLEENPLWLGIKDNDHIPKFNVSVFSLAWDTHRDGKMGRRRRRRPRRSRT